MSLPPFLSWFHMKRLSIIPAAMLVMALSPSDDMRTKGSNFFGAGGISCRGVYDMKREHPPIEVAQWILGYLSGVDGDIFSMRGTSDQTRAEAEGQIVETVHNYLKDFCTRFPAASLGDGMVALRGIHYSKRWDSMLAEIYQRWDIKPQR